jgi:hypothetical protein
MHSTTLLSAVAALSAGLVSAQSATCTKAIKITEPTPAITCTVIDADVTVDDSVVGALSLETVEKITGDFIVNNATQLVSISSTSLKEIGGVFELNGLTLLSSLEMQALRTLTDIRFIKLNQLNSLTFGANGVTHANSIQITDTRLSDLSGLNIATVEDLQIDNNHQLKMFNSDLVNITGTLIISSNGDSGSSDNMAINMTHLESANELQISNVKSFDAPALSVIEKSLKFDTNPSLTSFKAPNLTKIGESLTFINNVKLKTIDFAELTQIDGDLTIQNNTIFKELDGFPELKSVFGGILLAGSFDKVELPKLNHVTGAATATSTTDISDFCDFFDKAKSDGDIDGEEKCTSNNKKALSGGDGGDSGSGGDDSSSSDDDDGAAGMVSVNVAMLGLAAMAGIAQLF